MSTVTEMSPTAEEFAKYYTQWFSKLVDALNRQFSHADREDAVQLAFMKILFRDISQWRGKVPKTEKDWFACLLWQSKGALSHISQSRDTWAKYHHHAYADGFLTSGTGIYCTIDREIVKKSAFDTLYALCCEAGMKKQNVEAFIRGYLLDESTTEIERSTGIKANNLYQIKSRIMNLLSKRGKAKFRELRRRNFLQAA